MRFIGEIPRASFFDGIDLIRDNWRGDNKQTLISQDLGLCVVSTLSGGTTLGLYDGHMGEHYPL